MTNSISYVDNVLTLPKKNVKFPFDIDSLIVFNGVFVVLLDIPNDDDTIDNIFALNIDGKKLWRVQSVSKAYPNVTQFSPYIGMTLLENGNISATNYFGVNYEISIKDGSILKKRMVK